MLVRSALVCALGSVGLVASPRAFAADVVETGNPPTARTVEVVVVGSDLDLDAVRSTIGSGSFEGASVQWSRATQLEAADLFERRPEASSVEVRAWIDLSDPKNASLYFADRAGERFLVRAIALPDGLTPLGREALGQVLELSVRALLEDDRVGMSRAETSELLKARGTPVTEPTAPPPDTPPPPEPRPSARESSLGAEVFYGARLFSSEVPLVHGPGLGLGWITEGPETRSVVWVTGQYELSQELVTPEVGVEWTTLRVQGGFGFAVDLGSRFFAGGRVGAGADVTSFTPRAGSSRDDVALERSRVSTAPVLGLAFEASVPLASRLGASARLFASFHPVRVHYDLAREGGASEVLAPYGVRPGIELCLHLR